jgi:hypothetical protein
MKRNAGIIGLERSTNRNVANGIFDLLDSNIACNDTRWPKTKIFESISPNSGDHLEGEPKNFTVTLDGYEDGDLVYYTIASVTGSVSSSDFTNNSLTGSFTVNSSGQGTISKTLVRDFINETESYKIQIRHGSTSGMILGESGTFNMPQPSYTFTPSSSTMNEGDTLTFTLTGTNVYQGTHYYVVRSTGETKITPSDGAGADEFGRSVSVGSNKIVVGARYDDDNGFNSGSAYIYNLDGTGETKITASDGAGADYFGQAVAVGSNKIVVGAHADDDNGNSSGSAYVYDLDGTNEVKITASDGASDDRFGYAVAVGSNKIVVGAYADDDNGSGSGSVYVYDLDGTNEVKINASDAVGGDSFGWSVAVGNNKIVVGAHYDDDNGSSSGSAYIYDLDGTNEVKITASDGASNDEFGRSVSVGSNKIVVGARYDDDNGFNSGSAYVYDLDGTNEVKITASDGAGADYFGQAVAVGSNKIVVGAYADDDNASNSGSAYVYDLDRLVINSTDLSSLDGSFTLNSSGQGSFTITALNDLATEGSEDFEVHVKINSAADAVVGLTTITINDTSVAPSATCTPSVSNVDEGSSVTFTVNTTNYPSGTLQWESVLSADMESSDISATSGTVSISGSTGTISITATSDGFTETGQTESFQIKILHPDGGGSILVTSSAVTINDTSTGTAEPTGIDISSSFYEISNRFIASDTFMGNSSDYNGPYDVGEVQTDFSGSGRVYIGVKITSTTFTNDIPIAGVQVINGNTLVASWIFNTSSGGSGSGWQTYTSQITGSSTQGFPVTPQTASGYTYSNMSTSYGTGKFSFAHSTGSGNTGAADGIGDTYKLTADGGSNTLATVGDAQIAQTSSTYYVFREASGATRYSGTVMRSPAYTFSGGEKIRVIHAVTGRSSTPMDPDDSLFVAVY